MYCPSCNGEFRDGVTVCPDCGAELQDDPPPPGPVAESRPSTTVAVFYDLGAARVALEYLHSQDVESWLRDEQTVGVNWLWSRAIGGVRLEAPDESADRARELLRDLSAPGEDLEDEPLPREELELESQYRARAARQKRLRGWVALFLVNLPAFALGLLLSSALRRRHEARDDGLLPRRILCPSCEAPIELSSDERRQARFSCPSCGEDFDVSDE